ncbi:hypothetical protein MSG28_011187 [Choristoneura fumiferana]|uniref:Uncharacterized protein n=1 Tax=Choristoneura fumiferana TaxID=7141 RepID=A0ACC0KRP6_CHOFU|nr:hypothetical protein MSG28_011187 [Choristoneura fumiferana]
METEVSVEPPDPPDPFSALIEAAKVDPPTEDEIARNLAMAQLKKENAMKIEAKRLAEGGSLPTMPQRGAETFPKYSDYHTGHPDDHPEKKLYKKH